VDALPPPGERERVGRWPVLEPSDREAVEQWLATAHCDRTTPDPGSRFDDFIWSTRAQVRAHELIDGGHLERSAQTLVASWAAIQNAAVDGTLVPVMVALVVEGPIVEDLTHIGPLLDRTGRAALARDVAWLRARRPLPSVAADAALMRGLSVVGVPPIDAITTIQAQRYATPAVAAELDDLFAQRDVAGLQAAAARTDPASSYLRGAADVLAQIVTQIDENDRGIDALQASLRR
jgi:hypothetical protein